jgi:hypothetical protein
MRGHRYCQDAALSCQHDASMDASMLMHEISPLRVSYRVLGPLSPSVEHFQIINGVRDDVREVKEPPLHAV